MLKPRTVVRNLNESRHFSTASISGSSSCANISNSHLAILCSLNVVKRKSENIPSSFRCFFGALTMSKFFIITFFDCYTSVSIKALENFAVLAWSLLSYIASYISTMNAYLAFSARCFAYAGVYLFLKNGDASSFYFLRDKSAHLEEFVVLELQSIYTIRILINYTSNLHTLISTIKCSRGFGVLGFWGCDDIVRYGWKICSRGVNGVIAFGKV